MMNSETKCFVEGLFARCPLDEQPACLTLTAIHPEGDRPTPSRHLPLGDSEMLEQALSHLLAANRQGWGAFIGVALRRCGLGRWSRGGKHDLVSLPALFSDMDQPEEAMLRLGWFGLPATCILHSGRGYHAYWFLETPTTDFALADRAIRGLAQHLNGDEALTVAQSMRLPGTVNTKPGREAAVCSIVSYHPERLYDLREFEPFLPNVSHHPAIPGRHEGRMTDLAPELLDGLTAAVLHLLDGRWRSSGFIAARCPFPHEKDRTGMHFSYNPQTGWGYCFGKHGKVSPAELRTLLGEVQESHPSDYAA